VKKIYCLEDATCFRCEATVIVICVKVTINSLCKKSHLPHFYINLDDDPFGPKHVACSKEDIVLKVNYNCVQCCC
jgi:hypothetical protein